MKSLHDAHARAIAPGMVRPPLGEPALLGRSLESLFGGLAEEPLPDRMVQLADALEEAFRRGELFDADPARIA